jgi:cytochrome P450
MATFFLAMELYPEVQRKAQAELDSVIGSDRLPTMQDMKDLPYVRCVVKEVLRWIPPVPLGKSRFHTIGRVD